LNLLINNAGVMHRTGLADVTPDVMLKDIEANAVAPVMLSQAFWPLLKQTAAASKINGLSCNKAAIINMSTMMGSISDNTGGGQYAYRAGKAALNMVTKSLSVDLKSDGILAVVLHPGWVRTDMGGANGLIDTETCVSGILNVLGELNENDTGSFIKYDGTRLPW